MKRAFGLAALVLAGVALARCAVAGPVADAGFDPLRFFDGRARSQGTIVTALVRREPFTATFEGRRNGRHLVLDERFRFPEGERLQRWRLEALEGGRYAGTVETQGASGRLHAPVPVSGRSDADGLVLAYEGYAPGGDTLLGFRHRMRSQPDGTVRNAVRITKFGIPLAGADVVFERVPPAAKMR